MRCSCVRKAMHVVWPAGSWNEQAPGSTLRWGFWGWACSQESYMWGSEEAGLVEGEARLWYSRGLGSSPARSWGPTESRELRPGARPLLPSWNCHQIQLSPGSDMNLGWDDSWGSELFLGRDSAAHTPGGWGMGVSIPRGDLASTTQHPSRRYCTSGT